MRRRSSAPGQLRPDGHRCLLLLVVALAVAFVGCGSAGPTETTGNPSGSADAPASGAPSSARPPTASVDPSPPVAEPTDEPPTDEPSHDESAGTGGATSCSGSDENRDFFASMAAAVDWTVYCPVLPDGWFVGDGQYRLAGGGWMEITYNGPANAQLLLRQGFYCDAPDGCVPPGQDVDAAPFGDREGRLVAGADGSWSVVAERGSRPGWLIIVSGLGELEAREIAANLRVVD